MSGAASSSTTPGFHGLPQNSLNQRATIALLSSNFGMIRFSFAVLCPGAAEGAFEGETDGLGRRAHPGSCGRIDRAGRHAWRRHARPHRARRDAVAIVML